VVEPPIKSAERSLWSESRSPRIQDYIPRSLNNFPENPPKTLDPAVYSDNRSEPRLTGVTNIMSSCRRRAASRANGKKSKGPVTPEGKARSAANSTRHGLASPEHAVHGMCLTNENPAEFTRLYDALVAEHLPATTTEHLIVHDMAVARWRITRARVMDTALLDNQMDQMDEKIARTYESIDHATRLTLAFRELSETSPSLDLLHRYETRLNRQFDRALKQLNALRANRKEEIPDDPSPRNEHQENDLQPVDSTPPPAAQPAPRLVKRELECTEAQSAPEVDLFHHSAGQHDVEELPGIPPAIPRAA
jgi:hypothetical protein